MYILSALRDELRNEMPGLGLIIVFVLFATGRCSIHSSIGAMAGDGVLRQEWLRIDSRARGRTTQTRAGEARK